MKGILTTSIAALLVLGLTVPIVLADDGHRGSDARQDRQDIRDDRRDIAQDRKDLRDDRRDLREDHHRPYNLTKIELNITASGTDKDNKTWTIDLQGIGLAQNRTDNGTLEAFRGFVPMVAQLKDANGTIVKQGEVRVRIVAHQNETGVWSWHLVSVGKTPRGLPMLFLHGTNLTVSQGSASGDGHGFAMVKPTKEHKRVKIDLDAQLDISKL